MPVTKQPTATPPRDIPPLPRKGILPNELPDPKVTAISEEQKEAFRNSELTEEEISMEDPMEGALAFDMNAENFEILQNMIKDKVGATDDDIRTTYPRFNEPFITRNSVNTEHENICAN